MREVFLPEFLDSLKVNLTKFVEADAYLSFPIACAIVELIGKCYDNKINNFNHYIPKRSKWQFEKGIYKHFDSEYQLNHTTIYSNIRNGMAHSLLPKSEVWISTRKETSLPNLSRLANEHGNRLVVIIDDFRDDIIRAIDALKVEIENKNNEINGICYASVLLVGM